jgi:8-oxo-dGTP pyrophosphatase MutT (NUDIX family)
MTLFTARPAHLRRHPGQIGFPGGAFEEGDRTPADTALREAREEIGLSGDRVRLLGLLDPEVAYSSDFLVFPVVGWVSSPDALRGLEPDPCEVDRLIKVPLGIFSPEPVLEWRGEGPLKFVYPVFPLEDGDRIWGVTARILLRLIRLLHSMEVV